MFRPWQRLLLGSLRAASSFLVQRLKQNCNNHKTQAGISNNQDTSESQVHLNVLHGDTVLPGPTVNPSESRVGVKDGPEGGKKEGEGSTFVDLVLQNWHGRSQRNTTHIFVPLARRRGSEKK